MFDQWEKGVLLQALREADGNQGRAAKMLGIHRNTLSRKLIERGVTDAEIRATKVVSGKKWKLGDFLQPSR
jgi:DNA-binding NtrC family response regulator